MTPDATPTPPGHDEAAQVQSGPAVDSKVLFSPSDRASPVLQELSRGETSDSSSTEFAEFTHQYLRDYIAAADQKAAVIITVSGALLAFVQSEGGLNALHSRAWSISAVAGLASCILLVVACYFALSVVLPRNADGRLMPFTAKRKGDPTSKAPAGLIFWGDILAHGSSAAYADRVRSLQQPEATRAVSAHAYDLAKISDAKYREINRATRAGASGFALFLVFVLTLPASTTGAAGNASTSSQKPSAGQAAGRTNGAITGAVLQSQKLTVAPSSSSVSPVPQSTTRDTLRKRTPVPPP